MSATDALATPTIRALSASLRVSGPLADLMYSVLPSTLSMVPLTRWVCCADAVETANTVAKAAAVRIRIVLILDLQRGNPRSGYIGGRGKRRAKARCRIMESRFVQGRLTARCGGKKNGKQRPWRAPITSGRPAGQRT